MRANKIPIPTVINPEYNMVVLKIEKPFDDFLTHITIAEYDEWIENRLHEKYDIRIMEKNIVKFEYLTLLIDTDHHELLEVIEHMLQEFIAYSVEYPLLYEEQIEVLRAQLDTIDGCFLNPTIKGSIFNTFTFYFPHDSSEKQEIELNINRLQEDFKQEVLIYAIKDQLKSRISLKNSTDVRCFLAQIVKHYFKDIVEMIYANLERIGMKASIVIDKMDYYVKEVGTRGILYDVSGFNANNGLVFHIYGYQESYCKMYKFLQKWLDGLQTLIVEVQAIECCKANKLEQHFQNNFAKSHAILLQSLNQTQRILIFEPTLNKTDLEQFFKTSKRIITGLQFKSSNFSQLAKNWNEFIDFSQLKIKVSVHEDFLLADCTKAEEKWLRQKVEQFLENYKIEQAVIQQFSSKFQLSLFQRTQRQKFSIRNVEFYILKDVLYRKNFVKDTEVVCRELGEIYQRMKRRIVWKPISKTLPQRIAYFKESRAKEWENAECLESLQFKVEGRVAVNVRSFASISSKEEECIFVIENLKNCIELKRILENQGSTKIDERIIANPILGFSLRLCSFFDGITTCMVTLHNTRERIWIKRLKETFESLIGDHKDSRHLRFMFHCNSQESIKVLIPIIINSVKALSSLRSESKLKEVTFFTSLEGGAALRKQITLSLRELRSANVKIEMITQLNLRICDLEKIIAYGYYTLKYYENDRTMEASPLSSFVFHHEQKKKKKTPIFLPEGKYACQYLFNRFNATTYRVHGWIIEEVKEKFQGLQVIKNIVKQYFPLTDYFAVSGNEQGTHFSTRLFYTSPEERLYKALEKADLDPSSKKITIGREKRRYQLISNEFMELRRVETHSHMVEELMRIMQGNNPS